MAARAHAGRDVAAEAAALGPWFHNLHLPGGVQTLPEHPLGGDFPAFKWHRICHHVPDDLHGWDVLDIGCNAGFYSFELARRGAHVTAIDIDPHYLQQARWAAGILGLDAQIEFRQMQVYDLVREPRSYDLVWFMGVLYHLRHPLLALDIVRRVCRRMLVVQTMTMPGESGAAVPEDLPIEERGRLRQPGWPTMAFIEHRLASDPTNWWAADAACVEALLRSSGFDPQGPAVDETWACAPAPPHDPALASLVEAELRAATGVQRLPT